MSHQHYQQQHAAVYDDMLSQETSEVTDQNLVDIVANNDYVLTKTSIGKQCDPCSLVALIKVPLTQSQSTTLYNALEHIYMDIIIKYTEYRLYDIKHALGHLSRTPHHIFEHESTKTIYYAELKSNLNTDRVRTAEIIDNIKDNVAEIMKNFPGYTIKRILVPLRYVETNDIPYEEVLDKFERMRNVDIIGVNDYFKKLGVPNLTFTEERHQEYLNYVAREMFK